MRAGLLVVTLALGLLVTGYYLRPKGPSYTGLVPMEESSNDQPQDPEAEMESESGGGKAAESFEHRAGEGVAKETESEEAAEKNEEK